MDKSTITLLLGVTFGLAVVGVAIGFVMLIARAQTATPTISLAMPAQQYNNEERWSVVKDANGRVKDIIVHREATVG